MDKSMNKINNNKPRVFLFKTNNFEYIIASPSKRDAISYFKNKIHNKYNLLLEMNKEDVNSMKIKVYEDNDVNSKSFFISLNKAIHECYIDESVLISSNDYSVI